MNSDVSSCYASLHHNQTEELALYIFFSTKIDDHIMPTTQPMDITQRNILFF